MTDLLAYPLRLSAGRVASVVDGSDEAVTQQLRILVGTATGERPMMLTFGITSPAWNGITAEEVQAAADIHGPAVTVTVDTDVIDEQLADIGIGWTR